MQGNPVRKRRDYSGRVYKPRTCEDCPAVFVPRSSGQKRCPDCQKERRREQTRQGLTRLRESRREPAYCADCGVELPVYIGGASDRCADCRPDYWRRYAREQAGLPAQSACLDCGAPLQDRKKRCPECKATREDQLRRAKRERQREQYVPKRPRQEWPPTEGLEPRKCTVCSVQFQPYRGNQLECSRECRAAQPGRMQANSESAKRFAAKPGKRAAIKQRRRVRSIQSHGLTPEQYAVMLAEQGGVCALCGNPPDPHASKRANRLHIDHGHATGRVRALLCAHCNLGLGRFRDDPAVLRKAAAYVEHHTAA